MNIIQALDDPKVFGDFFRAGTWVVWRVFLAALFGLPMTDRSARDSSVHRPQHAADGPAASLQQERADRRSPCDRHRYVPRLDPCEWPQQASRQPLSFC
jgi:hypothetical protein